MNVATPTYRLPAASKAIPVRTPFPASILGRTRDLSPLGEILQMRPVLCFVPQYVTGREDVPPPVDDHALREGRVGRERRDDAWCTLDRVGAHVNGPGWHPPREHDRQRDDGNQVSPP